MSEHSTFQNSGRDDLMGPYYGRNKDGEWVRLIRDALAPDGKRLAFVAQYDGGTDVYVGPQTCLEPEFPKGYY